MMTVSQSSMLKSLSSLWCADVVTFREKRQTDEPGDNVLVHSAMLHIDFPYELAGVEDLPLVSRWVEGHTLLGRQDQDGTWRFFYGEGTKVVVIVQLHPWRRFVKERSRGNYVTQSIVARDGDAFARVSRWDLANTYCKLEIIGGHRPDEESDDRSVMVFTEAEARHLLAVLNNMLEPQKFFYFDDPLWRKKLNAVAERNVGETYEQWSLTLPQE